MYTRKKILLNTSVKYILAALALLSIGSFVGCQESSDSLFEYTSDFKFTEGVYPDFESVLRNTPIPKGRIISEYSFSDNEFFTHVLGKKYVYYFDNLGNRIEFPTNKIWGYSRNGFLYIQVSRGFYRITMLGSISHFLAYETTEYYNNYNPYNTSPYYNTYTYSSPSRSSSTEMRQYLLDFKTGQLMDYTVQAVEVLLMYDPDLHTEYMQLSKRKKKQMKFLYIRKFNERNPLYLIKNNE
ncbi:MAG: hypothetical protein JXA77_03575 [Bacteroidales bacterium]|nr:hypothetical protein [Bacteroidales bacterium]MBN2818451.1 hypothetical protein [Bacteroidales bacterium]